MTDKTKDHPIIILTLHETVADSWKKDAGSVIAAALLIGAGVVCGSPAMEWAGFWLFAIGFLGWAMSGKRQNKTPQQAADWLAETFNVRARP